MFFFNFDILLSYFSIKKKRIFDFKNHRINAFWEKNKVEFLLGLESSKYIEKLLFF